MAYKKEKTDQEWSQIRFQNSLGPQIGGLLHDAVALTIKFNDKKKVYEDIKNWLDDLYEIAESKKAEITKIEPVSDEAAKKAGEKFQKDYNKKSELDDINAEQQLPIIDIDTDPQNKII